MRGRRLSAIAAMSTEGIVSHELTAGTVNGEKFFYFDWVELIPKMQPFPNKQSVLVRDNRSVHHLRQLKDLIKDSGILLLYLPTYSPDYNGIEELFILFERA